MLTKTTLLILALAGALQVVKAFGVRHEPSDDEVSSTAPIAAPSTAATSAPTSTPNSAPAIEAETMKEYCVVGSLQDPPGTTTNICYEVTSSQGVCNLKKVGHFFSGTPGHPYYYNDGGGYGFGEPGLEDCSAENAVGEGCPANCNRPAVTW